MKRLVIAGGTGFLGSHLCRHFQDIFSDIVILSRSAHEPRGNVRYVVWDAATAGDWMQEIDGASVVINLCGKSVDCRYTAKNKAAIFASRLDSTGIIGKAIAQAQTPPSLWINAASATIYRHSEDTPMTEEKGEIGEGFSVEVCKAWENVFYTAPTPRTRKVNLRIGLVLGADGGVFPSLNRLVKLGLGGTLGNGRQLVSWLHVLDFCRMVEWCIQRSFTEGTYNCSAPTPVSNRQLMKLLRTMQHMPFGMPAPAWMLEIGAMIIRTETELILKSRYVVPDKATRQGFEFVYPTIEPCLKNILNR